MDEKLFKKCIYYAVAMDWGSGIDISFRLLRDSQQSISPVPDNSIGLENEGGWWT